MVQSPRKKRRNKQASNEPEIPEKLKDFIDSVIIKPEENVVVQTRRPKKQKEVKEDPKSKLTNRKVGL